jgi:hypothetical protein
MTLLVNETTNVFQFPMVIYYKEGKQIIPHTLLFKFLQVQNLKQSNPVNLENTLTLFEMTASFLVGVYTKALFLD